MVEGRARADGVVALGSTVRRARQRRALSVEQLAARSGVSAGSVSQLERGQGNPSLSTLTRLADAFGVTVVTLLQDAEHRGEPVVRADHRTLLATLDPEPGFVRELLTPDLRLPLQVIRTVMPPRYSNEGRPFRHLGTECAHVLEGRLDVVLDGVRHELGAGDTITYDCSRSHWWANPGDEPCVVLGAVTPVAG
ncbi:XRE family transcriptional regulator [Georgenia sp. M64]|uniref:helix-turn-helix domain-containing protein n=1 Tax=Georgenia sp. M64 TaxID=3120520 RepID=UPI0030E19C2A